MNNYTADNIHMLNAYYLQHYSQTEHQYTILMSFLRYCGLVSEYFHYLDSGELHSQVLCNDSSWDCLQNTYDY
jgi:hypothetical protein